MQSCKKHLENLLLPLGRAWSCAEDGLEPALLGRGASLGGACAGRARGVGYAERGHTLQMKRCRLSLHNGTWPCCRHAIKSLDTTLIKYNVNLRVQMENACNTM